MSHECDIPPRLAVVRSGKLANSDLDAVAAAAGGMFYVSAALAVDLSTHLYLSDNHLYILISPST